MRGQQLLAGINLPNATRSTMHKHMACNQHAARRVSMRTVATEAPGMENSSCLLLLGRVWLSRRFNWMNSTLACIRCTWCGCMLLSKSLAAVRTLLQHLQLMLLSRKQLASWGHCLHLLKQTLS